MNQYTHRYSLTAADMDTRYRMTPHAIRCLTIHWLKETFLGDTLADSETGEAFAALLPLAVTMNELCPCGLRMTKQLTSPRPYPKERE